MELLDRQLKLNFIAENVVAKATLQNNRLKKNSIEAKPRKYCAAPIMFL